MSTIFRWVYSLWNLLSLACQSKSRRKKLFGCHAFSDIAPLFNLYLGLRVNFWNDQEGGLGVFLLFSSKSDLYANFK